MEGKDRRKSRWRDGRDTAIGKLWIRDEADTIKSLTGQRAFTPSRKYVFKEGSRVDKAGEAVTK